jgi:membrane-associated protein
MHSLWDFIFHIDKHLAELVSDYGVWTYAILFAIIFAETGLVIAPFLPGDSLLFAAGVLTAPNEHGEAPLSYPLLCVLLLIAAIVGDTVNYHLGYFIGPRVFKNPKSFWLNPKHVERTQHFFDRYGGKTIIIARFLPIVRTLAPFIAGVGKMHYGRFLIYNVVGALIWVIGFVSLGRFIGEHVNFHLTVLLIISTSFLPPLYEIIKHRLEVRREKAAAEKGTEELVTDANAVAVGRLDHVDSPLSERH